MCGDKIYIYAKNIVKLWNKRIQLMRQEYRLGILFIINISLTINIDINYPFQFVSMFDVNMYIHLFSC